MYEVRERGAANDSWRTGRAACRTWRQDRVTPRCSSRPARRQTRAKRAGRGFVIALEVDGNRARGVVAGSFWRGSSRGNGGRFVGAECGGDGRGAATPTHYPPPAPGIVLIHVRNTTGRGVSRCVALSRNIRVSGCAGNTAEPPRVSPLLIAELLPPRVSSLLIAELLPSPVSLPWMTSGTRRGLLSFDLAGYPPPVLALLLPLLRKRASGATSAPVASLVRRASIAAIRGCQTAPPAPSASGPTTRARSRSPRLASNPSLPLSPPPSRPPPDPEAPQVAVLRRRRAARGSTPARSPSASSADRARGTRPRGRRRAAPSATPSPRPPR